MFIFNLLPPPGSNILPADERGEPWVVPEAAVEVQEQIADAIEKVCGLMVIALTLVHMACMHLFGMWHVL